MSREDFLQEVAILLERLEISHERWPIGCLLQLEDNGRFWHYEWDGEKMTPLTDEQWQGKATCFLDE